MSSHVITSSSRYEQLRERCEQQRKQMTQQFAAIETHLQTTDVILSTIGGASKRPELWIGALAGLWVIKRSSVWALIGRGWMIWSTARRMMNWFRR